ncbi:hypothetical protein E2I00_011108, partial [Balaenoptera physalus]
KARGAPVLEKTLGYNIWYFPENNTNLTETMNTTNQQLKLYQGGKAYRVYVISYNSLGESPVATLRIPAIDEKPFQCIEAMQTCFTQDQLVVEWQSSALEIWTQSPRPFPGNLCLRPRTGRSNELKPFWCYNISVYPMLQDRVGEPYSLQAYVKEGVPSAGPMTKAENIGVETVTITWKEIPKSQRNGFINNCTIFYQAEDGKEFSKTVNSSILQYSLESLTRKTSYTVQVMASTSAGGTSGTRINFKTLSISVFEIFVITSLVGGGPLILIILTVAYDLKKHNKLKHLCWLSVPSPAESSIATWCGDHFKDKLNLKEFDDSVNTEEDGILKPCSAPSDLTDRLLLADLPLDPRSSLGLSPWWTDRFTSSPSSTLRLQLHLCHPQISICIKPRIHTSNCSLDISTWNEHVQDEECVATTYLLLFQTLFLHSHTWTLGVIEAPSSSPASSGSPNPYTPLCKTSLPISPLYSIPSNSVPTLVWSSLIWTFEQMPHWSSFLQPYFLPTNPSSTLPPE